MNLTEEKKGPLRLMPVQQKKVMLEKFIQSKGTSRVGLNSFPFLLDSVYLLSSYI